MSGETVGIVLTAIVALAVGYWQFYLPHRERKRQKAEPPPAPPEDPFQLKWLARIDELEAEVTAERSEKVKHLVQCAQLKTELKHAEARRISDAETIQRLRARVDDLEAMVRGG